MGGVGAGVGVDEGVGVVVSAGVGVVVSAGAGVVVWCGVGGNPGPSFNRLYSWVHSK